MFMRAFLEDPISLSTSKRSELWLTMMVRSILAAFEGKFYAFHSEGADWARLDALRRTEYGARNRCKGQSTSVSSVSSLN